MPASGEVYQFTFKQGLQGQILETVIHFRTLLPVATEAALKLSADNFIDELANLQATEVTYPEVIIKQVTPLSFDEIRHIPTTTVIGRQSGAAITSTVALIYTKRTGISGPLHRGRMYVGGFPASWGPHQVSGSPALTQVGTTAGSLLAKFKEGGTDPTCVAGVYSGVLGGTHPFTVAGWQPITRWDPQLIFGNQRRRRKGVGI
jgi:hypothetical protein